MSYDTTIPKTGDSASQDYLGMQGNFAQIQSSFSVDHEPLATGGGIDGFHKKSTYVAGSDPAALVSAGIVYTKTIGSHTDLFYEGESVTGKILQITDQSLVVANGEGFIPGGLQIRSGTGTASVAGVANAFSSSFPTACISVVACANTAGNQVNVTSISASSVTVKSPQGNCAIYYIATGY